MIFGDRSRGTTSLWAAALLYLGVMGAASLHAQDPSTPETSLVNAGIRPDSTGEEIFRMACSTCHGVDGKGAKSNVVGFALPLPNGHDFPDFNDCPTNTVEPLGDWSAVVHRGGPIRALDHHMPAFGDALSDDQIEQAIKHLWSFCTDASWPRGDLNLPRAFHTEKAFPENETIWTTGVTGQGTKSVTNLITYEHRIKSRSQYEVSIPLNFQENVPGESWSRGLGDVEFALRRTFYANLDRGSIFAAGGAITLPTGKESEGMGNGFTIFEPFAMFGQIFASNGFVQFHGGLEVPSDSTKGEKEGFLRTAVGYTIAQDQGFGRAWTPMAEVLIAKPEDGEAEWDLVPQMQVSLSKLQHVLLNVGVRVPLNERQDRKPQFLTYVLWDWFDGGFFQFWK